MLKEKALTDLIEEVAILRKSLRADITFTMLYFNHGWK